MKKRKRIFFWIGLAVVGLLWSATTMWAQVWAQVSADYNLTWDVIGSGGPTANSTQYSVEWTAGQPFVDAVENDAHIEEAGFWAGIASTATPTDVPTTEPAATLTATPTDVPTTEPAATLTVIPTEPPSATPETTILFLPNVSN